MNGTPSEFFVCYRNGRCLYKLVAVLETRMTTFTTSAATQGSSDGVLQSAITTLTHNGFAITHRDATSVSLTGPGLNSSRQNPLLGASKITLCVADNTINADAELGGVDAMQRFLMRFPFLLGAGLGLFFGIIGGVVFGQQSGVGFGIPGVHGWKWMLMAIGVSMLPVAPWLILSPLMAKSIRKRTQNAIETLIRNAAFSARAI